MKHRKKSIKFEIKWLYFLLYMPILLVLVYVNYYFDPGNVFHDDSHDIAETLLNENGVCLVSGNVNEKAVKQYLIKGMQDKTECIVVGPSLAMGIRAEMAGTDSFYNLGCSGANYYDILAQFGRLVYEGKQIERVIFCVDSLFFDEEKVKINDEYTRYRAFCDYMLDILYKNHVSGRVVEENLSVERKRNVSQLFSISYFQEAVAFAGKSLAMTGEVQRWGITEDVITVDAFHCYCKDGSWIYPLHTRTAGAESVINKAQTYDMSATFTYDGHIGEKSKDTFDRLCAYLQNNNVDLELFLCPPAPALWDRIDAGHYPIFEEMEEFAYEMAEKYGAKITGSYNPYQVGVTNEDYCGDTRHIKHEKLADFFDFTAD